VQSPCEPLLDKLWPIEMQQRDVKSSRIGQRLKSARLLILTHMQRDLIEQGVENAKTLANILGSWLKFAFV
jgi:hypothetical protein